MLGYYLDGSDTKPGWQRLKVELKREHGEVRARSEFFVTNSTSDPDSSRANDISSALPSFGRLTSIPLSARWNNIEASQQQGTNTPSTNCVLPADASLINKSDNNHVWLISWHWHEHLKASRSTSQPARRLTRI